MTIAKHTDNAALEAMDIASVSQDLEHAVSQALDQAKKLGADQAEVSGSMDNGINLTTRMGSIESIEQNRDKGLDISVYFNHKKGHASTADLSESGIMDCVQKACEIAKITEADPCHGLADPQLMALEQQDLDTWHQLPLSIGALTDLTQTCEQAGLESDKQIQNSEGASFNSSQGMSLYANSHGFSGLSKGTRHSLSCVLVAVDANGQMQRDYYYDIARNANALISAHSIGQEAARRTVSRLKSQQLKTCKAPVLYVPELAKGLLGHLTAALSGGNLYRKSSFLLDSLGTTILPEFINITEQPHLKNALGSSYFDAEGVATQDRHLIKAGQVEAYILSSYSGRKLGLPTTANAGGTHNLSLEPGHLDFEGLLNEMETGLLLTETIGQGVNIMTGDYSRGAAGFWVEKGCIAYPVEEITIASNLSDMFNGIVAVGQDIDHRSSTRTGSILINEMTIAGA